MLDFIKEHIAPYIYNAALSDAEYVVERQYASIEEELEALEQPIKTK